MGEADVRIGLKARAITSILLDKLKNYSEYYPAFEGWERFYRSLF